MFLHDYLLACEISTVRTQTLIYIMSDLPGLNQGYYMPTGFLFQLVSCPNYLGEFIQWIGW